MFHTMGGSDEVQKHHHRSDTCSGALAVAPTLAAPAAWSDCLSNKVCLFQNSGGGGELLGYRAPGGGQGDCISMPAGVQGSYSSSQTNRNDRASSWATNRTC